MLQLVHKVTTTTMSLKRERKINFTQDENLFLADKYEEFKHVIDAQHKDANTNRKKKESWAEILQQHQARFTVERSLSDLKTKPYTFLAHHQF